MSVQEPEKSEVTKDVSIWRNVGKIVFLIVILAVAWYVLEWLIEGK